MRLVSIIALESPVPSTAPRKRAVEIMCESVNCGVVQTMKGGLTLANASVLSVFVLQFSSGAIYITFGKKHFADYDSSKLQKLCSTKDFSVAGLRRVKVTMTLYSPTTATTASLVMLVMNSSGINANKTL